MNYPLLNPRKSSRLLLTFCIWNLIELKRAYKHHDLITLLSKFPYLIAKKTIPLYCFKGKSVILIKPLVLLCFANLMDPLPIPNFQFQIFTFQFQMYASSEHAQYKHGEKGAMFVFKKIACCLRYNWASYWSNGCRKKCAFCRNRRDSSGTYKCD